MKVSETIPMTPQSWNKNPDGYVRHQLKLKELVEWFESRRIPVRLPEDTGTWDKGIDLYVGDLRIDLKSFGLRTNMKSLTWESTYYEGRPAPMYAESETDYFIHPTEGDPSTWVAARASSLKTSLYGFAPFYYHHDCVTVDKLVQDVFTSVEF